MLSTAELDYLLALWKAFDCTDESDDDRAPLEALLNKACDAHGLDPKTVRVLFYSFEQSRELKV